MRALWDYPVLPFKAVVPWPQVDYRGHKDWMASVDLVESWLCQSVGPRYSEWTWSMWSLQDSRYCSVSFRWEPSVSLFLLRFS
ncbi:MAG: hypothetical protein EBU90_11445 [Proteobacteria bacterium]|nr:hypothetical protein [Pseudomonadota bacterium]NBP14593.1 hypothetical protein [bacterium]